MISFATELRAICLTWTQKHVLCSFQLISPRNRPSAPPPSHKEASGGVPQAVTGRRVSCMDLPDSFETFCESICRADAPNKPRRCSLGR